MIMSISRIAKNILSPLGRIAAGAHGPRKRRQRPAAGIA
jgi:hypothetical protein